MDIIRTNIPEVIMLQPKRYLDERGQFLEFFNKQYLEFLPDGTNFVQDNFSHSCSNVLRGMHFQTGKPQGKLITCLIGSVLDVVVDLRKDSPTYKKWISIDLLGVDKDQVWVPAGFAHGFYVRSELATILYKTTAYYDPKAERTLIWNDPTIGIRWDKDIEPLLSVKDMLGKTFEELECEL
jgi:dTDP-4-dehydrorhamnose 3,5-epimerase